MAKHRGHNEGSVFKTTSGKYRVQVSLQGRRLSKTCSTAKEAREWLKKTLGQIDQGLTMDGARTTVSEFLEAWMAARKSSLKEKTNHHIVQVVRDHIVPYIGESKLKDVRANDLQLIYRKVEDNVGSRTAQIVHTILHGAFEYGLKQGLIVTNPTKATIRPKYSNEEMHILDESQVSQLLVAIKGHPREVLYYLAISTGMRQGEILGLRWSCIDWVKKTIRIDRQAQYTSHGWELVPPKTRYGRRTIVIGDNVVAKLREQYKRVSEMWKYNRWQDNDLVFPSRAGLPMDKATIYHEFKQILKDAGLPEIRFHDLRHTAASLMLNNNVPVLVVSRRLGHSMPSITLNVYGHLMPQSQQAAADLMDELITPIEVEI